MPLKKPKDLPKIPKTRKKKAEAAIAAIPQKKADKLEYFCKAFYEYDDVLKQQFAVLSIQTIVEFTSFAYEISGKGRAASDVASEWIANNPERVDAWLGM